MPTNQTKPNSPICPHCGSSNTKPQQRTHLEDALGIGSIISILIKLERRIRNLNKHICQDCNKTFKP